MSLLRSAFAKVASLVSSIPKLWRRTPTAPQAKKQPLPEFRFKRAFKPAKPRWFPRSNRNKPTGGPVLVGRRLERVIDQCSPKHLTVLSKGAKLYYNAEFNQ